MNTFKTSLLVVVLIGVTIIGFSIVSSDDTALTPPHENCAEPCEKDPQANKLTSPLTATQNKPHPATAQLTSEKKEQQSKRKKRPASELYDKFSTPPPYEDDYVEFVKEMLAAASDDVSGEVNLLLSKALRACWIELGQEVPLQERLKHAELTAQTDGGSNEDVLSSIAFLKKVNATCHQVDELVPVGKTYEYLQRAANLGLPRAKTLLAAMPPPGFDDWPKEKQQQHAIKSGKILDEARADCDASAFHFYASPGDWYPNLRFNDIPQGNETIRRYANTLALGLIYANSFEGLSAHYLEENFKELEEFRKTGGLSPYEIEFAETYGRELYKKYCQ